MKRILFILDIIICTCSFAGLYFFKTASFIPKGEYLTLFWVFILLWIFFSVYNNKYKRWVNFTFSDYFLSLLFSSTFTLFFLTTVVSLTYLNIVSRLFLVNIVALPSVIELSIVTLIRGLSSIKRSLVREESEISGDPEKESIKLIWIVGGFVLLSIAFFIMVRLEYGSFGYYLWLENILLILLGSWTVSVVLTGKYKSYQSQNLYYQIAPFIKSGFIMLIITGMVYFFLRIESLPLLVLFGTILIYTILEISIFLFVFAVKKWEPVSKSKLNVSNNENINIFGQEPLSFSSVTKSTGGFTIDIQSLFNRVSIKESEGIVQFLLNNIESNTEKDSVLLLSTTSLENINVLENQSHNLLINLQKLNDFRWLNEYLIACHSKIVPGGMLVGCFTPLELVKHKLRSKMPKFIFLIIYPIHFLFYRVFPKLPKLRHLYFVLTKGRSRNISKAEIFGRLHYCGYKIIAQKLIDNNLYFIAQKLSTISTDESPSYGPIIGLKRVGLNGEIITIHKFRTMHPYSEFIQKELFDNHNLNPSGKIKDDFRITNWGKIMRSLFIDELPQIYDWFQGKVKIVGVRALSEHYLSLYPEDLQKERDKQKPGLMPPYYADMPKSFDEILDSERTYLKRKYEKPFSTDFIYFWRGLLNILFRGARSS